MIRVAFTEKGDRIVGFSSAGHSGYAPAGRDIVCAGVSALCCTCVNALESIAGVTPTVRSGDGFLAADLPLDCTSHDAQVLLRALRQGIGDIAAQYPNYVSCTCLIHK